MNVLNKKLLSLTNIVFTTTQPTYLNNLSLFNRPSVLDLRLYYTYHSLRCVLPYLCQSLEHTSPPSSSASFSRRVTFILALFSWCHLIFLTFTYLIIHYPFTLSLKTQNVGLGLLSHKSFLPQVCICTRWADFTAYINRFLFFSSSFRQRSVLVTCGRLHQLLNIFVWIRRMELANITFVLRSSVKFSEIVDGEVFKKINITCGK